MSGTSGSLLQKSQLCFVSTRTSQNPTPVNDLEISTFMGNRSNFYGGYSISSVCVENNFFNVTSKQTRLVFIFDSELHPLQTLDLYVEPNFYEYNQLKETIASAMQKVISDTVQLPNDFWTYNAELSPIKFQDHDDKYNLQQYGRMICPTVDFSNVVGGNTDYNYSIRIAPVEAVGITVSPLSEVLGFIKNSWSVVGGPPDYNNSTTTFDGSEVASDLHILDRHSMLYLHSEALKHNSTYDGKGSTNNMIQVLHNGENYGDFINFRDEMGTYEPHFIFAQVRDLSVIDFSLRDERGELLETPTNNLHVIFRLFY